jgi:hypothetical protein
LTIKSRPGSEFFAAENEDSGTALKTRMGSEAVSGSVPRKTVLPFLRLAFIRR